MKKYAFLPGALMVVGALLWAALTLRWSMPALVVGAGGLVALGVGVAANWKETRDWFQDPRGVFVINSIISTLLLVAILGLVNAAVGLRAITFDWTEAGRNTLTAESKTILQHLAKDIVLKQFGRTHDPGVDRMLAAFAAENRRVRVSFVDIDSAPQDVKKYGVSRPSTVVAEAGTLFRKIEKVTEPALVTAMLQVTSTNESLVCFATGEGEHGLADASAQGLSGLAAVLAASNYKPERVTLVQGDVPQFCSALVIAGLPGGIAGEALGRVEQYLVRGGRVALLVDPPVDRTVVDYLQQRGIGVGQGVIIETSSAGRAVGAGPENPFALVYHEHPITRGFEQRTIFGKAVPLSITKRDFPELKSVASTGTTAFERVDLMSQSTDFHEGRDRRGPFDLALALAMPRGARDGNLPEPRLVVVGDSDFLANGLITWPANRDFGLRIIAWLVGEEEAHVVRVDERQNRRIAMTEQGRMTMYLVNMGLLPLLPLLAGIVHFFRSRR
ncbi:MAG: Gldg family protein [Acidobacteria bacterium]|nr:Gldg family protein [Acidobacteriota bacterium]